MKKIALTCAMLLSITLAGCSSTFAYNNLDWLIYWYLDDYVELDKQQKSLLDVKIEKWHSWHRKEELAKYREQISRVQTQLKQGPLNQQQWLDEFAAGRQHWERFRDQLSPELSVLALELNDAQVEALFEKLAKDDLEEVKERNEKTLEERLEENRKGLESQLKDMVGRLTKEQKSLIGDSVDQFESTFDEWIAYRQRLQQAMKTLLMQRDSVPNFSAQFDELIRNPDQFRSDTYKQASEHNRQTFARLVAQINTTLTKRQTKRLHNKLDDLIDDIDDLIKD